MKGATNKILSKTMPSIENNNVHLPKISIKNIVMICQVWSIDNSLDSLKCDFYQFYTKTCINSKILSVWICDFFKLRPSIIAEIYKHLIVTPFPKKLFKWKFIPLAIAKIKNSENKLGTSFVLIYELVKLNSSTLIKLESFLFNGDPKFHWRTGTRKMLVGLIFKNWQCELYF